MIRCRQCNTELTEKAHFCNVCGLPQRPIAPLQPSKSLTPSRSVQPGNKQPPKAFGNNPIRPKTVTRPPVFPTRPTSNGGKSPAAIPQRNPSQPALSPEPAVDITPSNSSSPASTSEAPKLTSQPETSNSAKAESFRTCSNPWTHPPGYSKIICSFCYPLQTRHCWDNNRNATVKTSASSSRLPNACTTNENVLHT